MVELVDGWIAYEAASERGQKSEQDGMQWAYDAVVDVCDAHPDLTFEFVRQVLQRDVSPKVLSALAAGPLEDLLARHGAAVIDRVEIEARQNPRFQHLLGGVWQNRISNEVWLRVVRVASAKW